MTYRFHPEIVEKKRIEGKKKKTCGKLLEEILRRIAASIEKIETHQLPNGSDPFYRARLIASGREPGLSRASEAIGTLKMAHDALKELLKPPQGLSTFFRGQMHIDEASIKKLVLDHSSVLSHLIPIDDEQPFKLREKRVVSALQLIERTFGKLLEDPAFSLKAAEAAELASRQAEEDLKMTTTRIQEEMPKKARVILCTIGSSHKIPGSVDEEDQGRRSLLREFGRLSISTSENVKQTVVIFDEAGCIPFYEFLGLVRLGRSIKALVCVGDKNQLPPYNAGSSRRRERNHRGGFGGRGVSQNSETVDSLLDVSGQTVDNDGKVLLKSQYRVPRDIANLLNARIYSGNYLTPISCSVPSRGFHFVDVPENKYRRDAKYVNSDEVDYCLELVQESRMEGFESIMILTPVSSTGLCPSTVLTCKL